MRKKIILIVAVFIMMSVIFIAQELPKCPKCNHTIYSSWWKYCPACGAELPEFDLKDEMTDNEVILGNIYNNKEWNFRIEKPSEEWKFLTGKEATDFNQDAILVIEGKDAYGMVIVEKMTDITLKEYEKLVLPKLDNAQVASTKLVKKGEYDGTIAEVEGSYEGAKIKWKMAIYKKSDNFYQLHCWGMASSYEKYKQECDIIIDSFKKLK